jgi:hypothetical protein
MLISRSVSKIAASSGSALAALLLSAVLNISLRLHAADNPPSLEVAPSFDATDVQSHVASVLRLAIARAGNAPLGQAIEARLSSLTVPASRADRLVLRLDATVTPECVHNITLTGALIRGTVPKRRTIMVEATLGQIKALALVPGVRAIYPSYRPLHRNAPVPDQADTLINTNLVRSKYGVSGSGQTIGLISDSLNMTAFMTGGTISPGSSPPWTLTGTGPQNSGVLPTSILSVAFGNPADQSTDTDEGESMMEEAYSLAPGAGYAFGAAGDSDTDMETSIQKLVSLCHCSVICDDVLFLDEPMFQDGPIAQAAEAVVQGGGIYCSAAGNYADQGIIMPFTDIVAGANDAQTNGIPNVNDLHNWGLGGPLGYLPITVVAGGTIQIVMQWNQPYASWALGPGSAADFDLYLTKTTDFTHILASSTDTQGTATQPGGDPFETLAWTNNGASSQNVYVAVDHVRGISTALLRLVFSSNYQFSSIEYPTSTFSAATTWGHPTAMDVLGVAAVPWWEPTFPEVFTSKGGDIPFYFDSTGATLPNAPQLRFKPDVAAPDGCQVSNPSFDNLVYTGEPTGFYGTSGATPNVAASAALAWCAQPGLSNLALINALKATATDIEGAPSTLGTDAWTGWGLVNGYEASGSFINAITTSASGTIAAGQIPITLTFSTPVVVIGTPKIELYNGKYATYASGSGTSTLTFVYTISFGDQFSSTTSPFSPAAINSLILNGGKITDMSANLNPADLALPQAVGQPDAPAQISTPNGTLIISALGPSVTITGTPSIANHPSFTFAIVFSEPVTSFSTSNLQFQNCTAGTLVTVTPNLSYTMTVTAVTQGLLRVIIPNGVIEDANSYPGIGGLGSATYDITPPTLAITGNAGSLLVNQSTVVTFTFSKPVTNFTAGSITFSGGAAASPLSGSGSTYTMSVTATSSGVMSVSVPAGSAQDSAGNQLATEATWQVQVNSAPESKGCGIGSIGVLLTLIWFRRQKR